MLIAVLSGVGSQATQKLSSYFSGQKHQKHLTSSGPPVTVDEAKDISDVTGGSWISQKEVELSPNQLDWLHGIYQSDRDAYVSWFKGQGAISRGGNLIELDLVGNRSDPVRIMNIQPVSQCRAASTSGTLFYLASQGQENTISIYFDLGQVGQGYETWSEGGAARSGNYFAAHKYTLAHGEHVTFRLSIGSQEPLACNYRLKIDVIADKGSTAQLVDDQGKPFQFESGALNFPKYQRLYVGTPYCGQSAGGQWKQVNPKSFNESKAAGGRC
ncbi:hypothetical protein [Actinoallomurus rhizosphaericola]|uniref:hypothetical protein n=1 Tax=Actinoallomurus rhizosphaericola TaxID=2952536 RepID=UPI002093F4ED|nr:hypothetical protein [Actinoallomurus rhizosphaericola]MCO5996043.1 hypothetical protein [Actinoallomurus rhizosphaericola]